MVVTTFSVVVVVVVVVLVVVSGHTSSGFSSEISLSGVNFDMDFDSERLCPESPDGGRPHDPLEVKSSGAVHSAVTVDSPFSLTQAKNSVIPQSHESVLFVRSSSTAVLNPRSGRLVSSFPMKLTFVIRTAGSKIFEAMVLSIFRAIFTSCRFLKIRLKIDFFTKI